MNSMKDLVTQAQLGDQQATLEILQMYMWLIDAHSRSNGLIDEDCKQTIIEQVIQAIMHQ